MGQEPKIVKSINGKGRKRKIISAVVYSAVTKITSMSIEEQLKTTKTKEKRKKKVTNIVNEKAKERFKKSTSPTSNPTR